MLENAMDLHTNVALAVWRAAGRLSHITEEAL